MDYIYDIVLNFQDKYYDFYEWNSHDQIVNFKKLPIYKITTKDYINIKHNDILIERKTLPKNNRIFLLTNGIEVMGILIATDGKVLKKSSLLFEENDEILEDKTEIINNPSIFAFGLIPSVFFKTTFLQSSRNPISPNPIEINTSGNNLLPISGSVVEQ